MYKFPALMALCLSLLLAWSPVTLADNHQLNINIANAEQIAEALDGIGEVKALAIIALREELGGFTNLSQLLQVKGIGPVTVESIKDKIVLE